MHVLLLSGLLLLILAMDTADGLFSYYVWVELIFFLILKVFPCVSATCGHFYHPKCVSKRVFPDDHDQAQKFQKGIEGGASFICPAHSCVVCKKGEDKSNDAMQFAVCRRCPKAYHRKCLPRLLLYLMAYLHFLSRKIL